MQASLKTRLTARAIAMLLLLVLLHSCVAIAVEPAKLQISPGEGAVGGLRSLGEYIDYSAPIACAGRPPGSTEIFPEAQAGDAMEAPAPFKFLDGRNEFTVTKVADGSIIAAGGMDQRKHALSSVRIWDPAIKHWKNGAAMHTARFGHRAVLLDDGRLMVTGGIGADGSAIRAVEIYDRTANRWAEAAPLLLPLQTHSAASLCGGDVLVLGTVSVENDFLPAQVMLWKKSTGQWLPAGRLRIGASNKGNDTLTFYLAPQRDGSALVYSHQTLTGGKFLMEWSPTQPGAVEYYPGSGRSAYAEAPLPDGRVLLAGGHIAGMPTTLAEIYDPAANRFTLTGQMRQARMTDLPYASALSASVLADGRVIVAGGWVEAPDKPGRHAANSPDLWDPATGRWSVIKGIRFAAADRVIFNTLDDGRVLFFASREYTEHRRKAEFRAWVWNPADNKVIRLKVRASARVNAAITVLKDGRVLIVGGQWMTFVPAYRCEPDPPQPVSQDSEGGRDDGDGCNDEPAEWNLSNQDPNARIWNSRNGTVESLSYPMGWQAVHPQTLLLHGGDVLIGNVVDASPEAREARGQVLRWNAGTKTFTELPTLRSEIVWPLMERMDGSLIAWDAGILPDRASQLRPGAMAWDSIARFPSPMKRALELPSGQLLALDSSSPYIARFDDETLRWQSSSKVYVPGIDPNSAAIVESTDGTVAVVENWFEGKVVVQLRDPKSGLWKLAQDMLTDRNASGKAIRLASGAVMSFSTDFNGLLCDIWLPKEENWVACGAFRRTPAYTYEFVLGKLADGRPAMIADENVAMVYDESGNRWTPMQIEWHVAAPPRAGDTEANPAAACLAAEEKPLARVFDETVRKWIDAAEVGERFRSRRFSNNAPAILFNADYSERASLLWDAKTGCWKPVAHLAADSAYWLPDGCVLSGLPFGISEPSYGKKIVTPRLSAGLDQRTIKFTVLADGTLVGVGDAVAADEFGSQFFHHKASCAGFDAAPP